MDYITLAQLAEKPGARELAQVATAEHVDIVDPDLMEATLRGDDRSAWEADDIAAADDAVERITGQMDTAESVINGFLAKRGYALPLTPVPKLVTGWTRDIGRYFLHKDRISSEGTDPILRAYKDAMKLLAMVADGSFSLGIDDAILNDPNGGDVQFVSDTKVFGRNELGAFR